MLIGGLLFILLLVLAFGYWITKQLENARMSEEHKNR